MQSFPLQTLDQLPDLLRAFRRKQGLTQAQAAVKLGVTQQVLSSIERAPGKTSVGRLYQLLTVLNVTINLTDSTTLANAIDPAGPMDMSKSEPGSGPHDHDLEW